MTNIRSLIVGGGVGLLSLTTLLTWGGLGSLAEEEEQVVCIKQGDSAADVKRQIALSSRMPQRLFFNMMASATGYYKHIRPGRYDIGSGTSTFSAFRKMRNGTELPMRLTIPSTLRTTDDLAEFLGEHLAADADDFRAALTDSTLLASYGLREETATCLFLPNTYEVYWSTPVEKFFERMQRESDNFWTAERQAKLATIGTGFTKEQAITLASIVEQETQNNPERPDVAGMYINRLNKGMPLQADPTVKFALGDFSIKRIMHKHLEVNSHYNTYKVVGLPPGPICIPSLASIDAVLNYRHHNYLYMCAKEDFSGSHNFAVSYSEHLKNAAKYAQALNEHGIK